MTGHVEPTNEQLAAFIADDPGGPIVMLNLLRYREVADYAEAPDLAPASPISGHEAYQRYSEGVLPILAGIGGGIELFGPCHGTLIGPADEAWDEIVLVRYPDTAAFVGMVSSAEYQAITGHRTAALADSRLVRTNAARV